jgi:hypothetical protein
LITPDQGAPALGTGSPAPTGSKPAVSTPTVSKPAVSKPAVSKPAVSKPTGSKPASSTPAARPVTPKPSKNRPVVRPEPDPGVLGLVPGPRERDIEPPEPGAEPAGPELRGVPTPHSR